MNNIAILYVSIHHGNTKKLIDGIANQCKVDLIKVADADKVNLLKYDVVGFASGIYNGSFHKSILEFVEKNPALPDKLFTIQTSGIGNKKYAKSFISLLEKYNHTVIGSYSCRGYDTYGAWKLIGGISKSHPTQKDINKGIEFIVHQVVF